MKLKEVNFNDIPYKGICIFVDGKEIAMGFIGDVLRKIPIECADYEIESTNPYFDVLVFRLTSGKERKGDCL